MRAVAVVVGTVVGAVVVLLSVLLAGLRWQVGPAVDAIRRMNRSVTNPRVMRTAGTPQTQTSVIEHIGRNSGRSYQTPVDVIETPTGLLIALPYRTRADWLRNVQAAGSATVVMQGRRITVTRPTVVATADVADQIPKRTMRMLRLFGVGQFLHLEKS
ncbi:nitroreductase family deazaflavin-dependent oxidoreductase [Mycobacterium sp. 3519A]|jgi:deazaflavin-dependent oxidoreductase (nitroreductase family)|uniref:nitroreductase family deazaflavin-dependent oxidoreductase n=1 Tax=Mycobacterium sp. 3519A TaxID=2057184 RepID=UPI000C798962|nr:nitroreductase family deazaflavin-dependent oxidoreductase [Mycobacterium sp. 3519A]